jgi:hypothetical protein
LLVYNSRRSARTPGKKAQRLRASVYDVRMRVTIYRLQNSFVEKSPRSIIDQFDAPLPVEFDPKKDNPEEIEVHVTNGREKYTYDVVEEPPPGHIRFRVLIPDGFQIITVSTTVDSVAVEVGEVTASDVRSQRWRW